jgi:hypothetical protein
MTLHIFETRVGGYFVETRDPTSDPVEFCGLGGWMQKSGHGVFHRMFEPAIIPGYKAVMVSGDWDVDHLGVRKLWPAYCDGRRWNGWAIPYFVKSVAVALAEEHPDALAYDSVTNLFRVKDQGPDEEYDVAPTMIEINGKFIETFNLIDGWCWEIWR